MRLLEFFENDDYCLTNFMENTPFYGIWSHTWGGAPGDEITYEEMMDGTRRSMNDTDLGRLGFRKLQFCQQRAAQEGLRYFWIDTCCINKQDQSELSYALNSMFYWYKKAVRCYVYMSDVAYTMGGEPISTMKFENSQWFTRGWTLQELLAPASVIFYSQHGTNIGDKRLLGENIYQITKIPVKALRESSSLSTFSVDERFRWTDGRETTVPEDMAYCLLGIFGVWMTPVYADGDREWLRSKAVKELKSKIENEEVAEKFIVIGGASWSDLSALGDYRLQELDREIRGYTSWLLQQGQPPTQKNLAQM